MTHDAWHPFDEAEAVSNVTAFVEWLRADRRHPTATPHNLEDWAAENPDAYAVAITDFLGLDRLPEPLRTTMAAIDRPTLIAMATRHLMAETRPDDRMTDDGALLLGARPTPPKPPPSTRAKR